METKILSFQQMTETARLITKLREIFGNEREIYPVLSALRNKIDYEFNKVLFQVERGEIHLGNTDDFLQLLEEYPEVFYNNGGAILELTLKQLRIYRDARSGYRLRIHQLLMNKKVLEAVKDESLKEAETLWKELVS